MLTVVNDHAEKITHGHFIIDELLNNFNVNEKETVNDKLTFECLSCPIASTVFNTKKKVVTK